MSDPEFIPRLPREDVNVDREHPLRAFARVALGMLLIAGFAHLVIGSLSQWSARVMSLEQERRWFPLDRLLSKQTGSNEALSPEDQRLLGSVASRLLPPELQRLPLSLSVICRKDPNAFAAPGGHVILTSELIRKIQSENGLAFILAHELGHVRKKHGLQAIGRKLTWFLVKSMVSIGDDRGLLDLLGNGGALANLSFSREQESEADRFAQEAMVLAYGHLQGADELFVALKSDKQTSPLPDFLSTHPGTDERIQSIREHRRYIAGTDRILPSPVRKVRCPE